MQKQKVANKPTNQPICIKARTLPNFGKLVQYHYQHVKSWLALARLDSATNGQLATFL